MRHKQHWLVRPSKRQRIASVGRLARGRPGMRGDPSDLFRELDWLERLCFCNTLLSRGLLRVAPLLAALFADLLPRPFVHRSLQPKGHLRQDPQRGSVAYFHIATVEGRASSPWPDWNCAASFSAGCRLGAIEDIPAFSPIKTIARFPAT